MSITHYPPESENNPEFIRNYSFSMKKALLIAIPLLVLLFFTGCTTCDEACYKAKAAYESQQLELEKERSKLKTQMWLDEAKAKQEALKAQRELEANPEYQRQQAMKAERDARDADERLKAKQAADIEYMANSKKVHDAVEAV